MSLIADAPPAKPTGPLPTKLWLQSLPQYNRSSEMWSMCWILSQNQQTKNVGSEYHWIGGIRYVAVMAANGSNGGRYWV